MSEITEKNYRKVDNSSYRERFQFQLLVNDNIICQRYFKIPRFNSDSLISGELFDTLRSVVDSIKKDLVSKSRVYLYNIMESKTKLTGFASKLQKYDEAKKTGADDLTIRHILLNDEDDDTYVTNPAKQWDETEFVNEGEVTFKFMFMVDDKPVYSEIWDGSQYPKYVRNSVDITNSRSQYPMVQLMNNGKQDLAVATINKICHVCSNADSETEHKYTKSVRYGDKKYSFSPYNRDFVNGWRNYCFKKYGYDNTHEANNRKRN